MPEGNVGEEAAELLQEFVRPGHHHEAEETLIEADAEYDEEQAARAKLPWWKRPSPVWCVDYDLLIKLSSLDAYT